MRQVVLEVSRVGQGFMQEAGQVIELEDQEAFELVSSGQARFAEDAAIETQMMDTRQTETAVLRRGRKR